MLDHFRVCKSLLLKSVPWVASETPLNGSSITHCDVGSSGLLSNSVQEGWAINLRDLLDLRFREH